MATLCPQQYNQNISGCSETITFDFGDTTVPSTDYVLLLKYANQSQRLIEVETDADNKIILENNDLWHNGTDVLLVQLFALGGCLPLAFTNCEVEYSSMSLTFLDIVTDATNVDVPCTCA